MKWRKQGLIFVPSGEWWWARSYATVPTAEVLDDQRIRIYFASLDENRYGRIGYVDVAGDNPSRILDVSKEPILDIGELGAFDDCGVNPSCVVNVQGSKYLYYIGWQRCERVPYMLFLGLAVSDDSLTFRRAYQTPILDRTVAEPFLRSAVTILEESQIFRAWYVCGLGWTQLNSILYPIYVIRYAESNDGVHWNASLHTCIDFADEDEFGFGRPWVVRDENTYKMWYSIRSRARPYRIGYAESSDGLHWNRRDDEVGIDVSDSGWDSEMICYPSVIDLKGKRYMFYNGNRHGSSGFGYAVWES
jgi:hypothetical protein